MRRWSRSNAHTWLIGTQDDAGTRGDSGGRECCFFVWGWLHGMLMYEDLSSIPCELCVFLYVCCTWVKGSNWNRGLKELGEIGEPSVKDQQGECPKSFRRPGLGKTSLPATGLTLLPRCVCLGEPGSCDQPLAARDAGKSEHLAGSMPMVEVGRPQTTAKKA